MLRYAKLLAVLGRASLQRDTAYRTDFWMRILVSILQTCGELLALWTIFANTPTLAGWSAAEVVVLLGVFRFVHGVIGMFIAPNMRAIMEDVRTGALDFVLLRPVNSQFLASFRTFVPWRVGDLGLGLGLALVGAARLGDGPGPGRILLFLAFLSAAAVVIYSFWLILATSVFWFTRINNIEMVFWNAFEAGRYPIDIYRPWVRWSLTFIVPLALLTTFPAGVLVGKTSAASLATVALVAAATLAAATAFWRYGLRHYSGASA